MIEGFGPRFKVYITTGEAKQNAKRNAVESQFMLL